MTVGPPLVESRAAGVWTLEGGEWIIAEPDGPATLLVPTEQVALLAVDLPVSGRAKQIAALPFAIEDRIAEPVESVHIALGREIAPKRFLVGVVRHEVMADWVERAEAAGLGLAAMVPDALALPTPPEGGWSVDLEETRALVRAGDGTGFACPAPMLRPAWQAAGNPPCIAYGAPLPADMELAEGVASVESLEVRLGTPALDLRQGIYARSRGPANFWRRLGWIVVIGAAAHAVIAGADALMLRSIADRRAAEAQALVASMGGPANADPAAIANLLPGAGGAPQVFLPLLNRVSGALTPLSGGFTVRSMAFQANTLTMDLDTTQAALAGQIRAALAAAQIQGSVAESPGGGVRVTAS